MENYNTYFIHPLTGEILKGTIVYSSKYLVGFQELGGSKVGRSFVSNDKSKLLELSEKVKRINNEYTSSLN